MRGRETIDVRAVAMSTKVWGEICFEIGPLDVRIVFFLIHCFVENLNILVSKCHLDNWEQFLIHFSFCIINAQWLWNFCKSTVNARLKLYYWVELRDGPSETCPIQISRPFVCFELLWANVNTGKIVFDQSEFVLIWKLAENSKRTNDFWAIPQFDSLFQL